MTGEAFVSTLVAPKTAALSIEQIQSFVGHVEKRGCKVEKYVLLDDRATDVFFLSDAALAPPAMEGVDIITQPAATRCKKILIADMESTVIGQEMLDEMANILGIGEKIAEITHRAMNGELDFTAALVERVGLLKGQPISLLDEVAGLMTINEGAEELVKTMKRAGAKAWLVSGGFTFFVKQIAEQIGFDEFYANELQVEKGVLTGRVAFPILDKNTKKSLLENACAKYGYALADSVTVGDGANDIPMLLASDENGGLGVAYHAKPKVRQSVANQINYSDFTALIYAQGLSK